MRARFLLPLLIAGCTEANPAATCSTGTCSDPAFPYCDSDGVIGGSPGKCLAVSCTPGEIKTCAATDALTCNATGNGYDRVACAHACTSSPQPHCDYLEPKWLPDICDVPATMDSFMPTASATFDVDTDANCTGGLTLQQSPGHEICVVRYKTITLPENITLTISGTRPIAFVADDAIMINGVVDAGASLQADGPGGGAIASGAPPTATVGGGGAGFAQTGGSGGNATGNGGAAFDPSGLPYFAGGPHAGATSGALGVKGGSGGGAVLMVSCRGAATLSSSSIIDLRGTGGDKQHDTAPGSGITLSDSAAGGGAGGYLAVQALTGVTMTGQVYANGGGGGGADSTDGGFCAFPGQEGQRTTTTAALGGMGCGSGGKGGKGGLEGTNPESGIGSTYGGGGGGSIGVVHAFTPSGVAPSITASSMSPVPATRPTATR